MDGATSGTCRDLKRVETDPLAIEKEGQHERRKRTTNNIPRPSTPPAIYPRSLTGYVDPPRRRGRIKSRSGKIRRTKMKKSTYRIIQPRRGQIRRIKRIRDAGEPIPARYRRSTTLQRSRIQDRAHSTLPEPRLTIYGHRSMQPHTDAGLFSSFI